MAQTRRDRLRQTQKINIQSERLESLSGATDISAPSTERRIWPAVIAAIETTTGNERYTVHLMGGDGHDNPMLVEYGVARPGADHTSPLTVGMQCAVVLEPGRRGFILPGAGLSASDLTAWLYVWNEGT